MNSSLALHNVFSDHMVVQREKPIRFSGTASAKSHISGTFAGFGTQTQADADGHWVLEFPAMPAGGPHTLTVMHSAHPTARIVVRDILVGDVWFCSGQSNMEFPVWCENRFFRLKDGLELAEAANDDGIRLFQSPLCVEVDGPCSEPPGRPSWKPATTAEAVKEFSAVGYWFGLTLRKKLGEKIPIGLINSSWGGTMIEPWISEEAFRRADRKQNLSQIERARLLKFGDEESKEKATQEYALARAELDTWIRSKYLKYDPQATAEALAHWATREVDAAAWKPVLSAGERLISRPSIVWFRCEFELPNAPEGARALVHIGSVNDCDETFLDGEKIGETTHETEASWSAPRNYATELKASADGCHVLAIRAMDHFSTGGIQGNVTIAIEVDGATQVMDLLEEGTWTRRTEFEVDASKIGVRPDIPSISADLRNNCQTPSTLFNAMVHPYLDLALKGVIWYQGCSNAGNPMDYLVLQKLWIDDWRRAWKDETMPFLITQLSAFAGHNPENRAPDDFWVTEEPLDNVGYGPQREVQDAMFDYPLTGVACTIDIGDHSDIHPANKKDVGIRLANEAMRLAYGDKAALPGPRFASVTREGAALRVSFSNVGEGLVVKGGALGPHLFSVAGEDGTFVWADATLCDDNTVLVSSPSVAEPVNVRYAFSAFPPCPNLYRKGDDLPVFPFRTDLPEYVR